MSDTNLFTNESVPVPAPVSAETNNEKYDTFNQDDILYLINSVDEDGHSPCHILAELSVISNIREGMTLLDVTENDKREVDDMEINDCAVDLYTMDGELINAVFIFDSEKNAYLQDMKHMLDRYRKMQEEIANNEDISNQMPVFSIAFMPYALEGRAMFQMAFPVSYFRTLNDSGTNTCMHVIFHANNLDFISVDINSSEVANIEADVLREMENGTGGSLFEENMFSE